MTDDPAMPVPAPAASGLARLSQSRTFLQLVYWGSAAILAPWIVILFDQQPVRGHAYHFRLVGLGASVFLIAGLLATATACRRGARVAVIAGVYTATMAFITAWFSTVTATGGRLVVALVVAAVIQLPVVAVCAVAANACFDRPGLRRAVPRFVAPTLLGALIALIPLAIVLGTGAPSVRAAAHLRLVWTGLDVLELAGLAATGWCIRHRLRGVAVAATFTGTLLFADAWFNVVATTGRAQLAAVVMAGAELPLAALSFVLGRREVAGWPDDGGHAPSGGRRPVHPMASSSAEATRKRTSSRP